MNPTLAPLSIPVKDASEWIGRWQFSPHILKANSFTFDADEFIALLNEQNVVKVRLYVGLTLNEDGSYAEKLLAVGVDKDGLDIINPKRIDPPGETDEPGDDGTGIYDFSHPCPPICEVVTNNWFR